MSINRQTYLSKAVYEEESKPRKFFCSIRNILADYNIKALEMEIACETPVEACVVFYQKHGKFPTDIHEGGARKEIEEQVERLKDHLASTNEERYQQEKRADAFKLSFEKSTQEYEEVKKQRDNFSKAMEKAVVERDVAVHQLERLHELAKATVAALTIPLRGESCD